MNTLNLRGEGGLQPVYPKGKLLGSHMVGWKYGVHLDIHYEWGAPENQVLGLSSILSDKTKDRESAFLNKKWTVMLPPMWIMLLVDLWVGLTLYVILKCASSPKTTASPFKVNTQTSTN